MNKENPETFHPENEQEWRSWLEENHLEKQSIWLIYYKKSTGKKNLAWSEAVDQALCFGWIDSTARPIDENTYMQFFTKRKPKSPWSKINKEKVARLLAENLIAEAGLKSIEIAKENGAWTFLDEVEELIVPKDLLIAFEQHTGSKEFFEGLSKSVRKMMLHWIASAKQDVTRQKRIHEIAEKAGLGMKPKNF